MRRFIREYGTLLAIIAWLAPMPIALVDAVRCYPEDTQGGILTAALMFPPIAFVAIQYDKMHYDNICSLHHGDSNVQKR